MSNYRTLAKNVGILTIANFGTKFLSFLLVPLYTSVLTTSDYGTYDLVFNTISVLIPILTANVVDAVLRFSIDEGSDSKKIMSVGFKYFMGSMAVVCLGLGVNCILGISQAVTSLSFYIAALFGTQALSGILLYCARGLNRFTDVAVSSVVCSAATIGLNVLLLVVFRMGLRGYFLANTIGPAIQIVYLLIRLGLKGVNPFKVDRGLEREMIAYSRPLIANSIAWWVNNVSDRYIVTLFCGVATNGVYSVASKIPSILSIFQTIIGQAWTISAVDEFDAEDKSGFFSNMYSLYNCLMVVMCAIIIAFDIPLARFLYAKEFFDAWRYVPFLTVSIVFGAMAGYIGGILAAVKDSKEFARTSVIGAISNIALNIILVPFIGPLGSALATAFCYWLTWFLRFRVMGRYIHLRINIARDFISYTCLILQGMLLLICCESPVICIAIQLGFLALQFILFRNEIKKVLNKIVVKLKG